MRYREAARKLRRLGCEELTRRTAGSHRKWVNPATGKGTVIPDWGAKDLKLGTVQAAVSQLGLDWAEFEDV